MTASTSKMTDREISGNNSMRHYMPVPWNHTRDLQSMLARARAQLEPLDAFNHDEMIPEELHAALCDIDDAVPRKVDNCVRHLAKSLDELRLAHREIEGIFGGEERDRYEELLARGIRSAEDRLARMTTCQQNYATPRQPFAIRRGTLFALECAFDRYARWWEEIRQGCEGASDHLMAQMTEHVQELARLAVVFGKLRKTSSQKMSDHLAECSRRLDAVMEGLDSVQSEACRSVLGPDRRVIQAAA
jgi:hypothetical protein